MKRLSFVGTWALVTLLSSIFILAGVLKLAGPAGHGWSERFAKWGYPAGFQYVVGAVEVFGGISLMFPRVRLRASTVLVLVMIGALLTHLAHGEFPRVIVPLILGAGTFAVGKIR
jgi:uncharacterized membrane protein YphA (DoxX/SURF4 family)